MTRQCREVLAACDFSQDEALDIERFLTRATPAQVIALVWGKDPAGERRADWFAPFFERGYVRSKVAVQCSFDGSFMEAYAWLSQALPEDFSTFDLPIIDEMARDLSRMRRAFGQSRVKKVPYVYKVWQGMAETHAPYEAPEALQSFEVGARGAIPRGER